MGAAFFSLWIWLLPKWLGFSAEAARAARWRWLAAVPSVLGFAVGLRCIWDFGWTGRGTPAPFVPPQRLVAVGVYRHVLTSPSFCTKFTERVYITALGCKIKFGTIGLQAAGAGGLWLANHYFAQRFLISGFRPAPILPM